MTVSQTFGEFVAFLSLPHHHLSEDKRHRKQKSKLWRFVGRSCQQPNQLAHREHGRGLSGLVIRWISTCHRNAARKRQSSVVPLGYCWKLDPKGCPIRRCLFLRMATRLPFWSVSNPTRCCSCNKDDMMLLLLPASLSLDGSKSAALPKSISNNDELCTSKFDGFTSR